MLLSGAPPFNGDSSEKIHHLILVSWAHSWRTKPSLSSLHALPTLELTSHSSYTWAHFTLFLYLSSLHTLPILHATVLCLHTCHFIFHPQSTLTSTHFNMQWFTSTRFEIYHCLTTSSLSPHHLTFKTLLFALHSLSFVTSLFFPCIPSFLHNLTFFFHHVFYFSTRNQTTPRRCSRKLSTPPLISSNRYILMIECTLLLNCTAALWCTRLKSIICVLFLCGGFLLYPSS